MNGVYPVLCVLSSSAPSVVKGNARAGCTLVFFDVHRVGCPVLCRRPRGASRIARDFFSGGSLRFSRHPWVHGRTGNTESTEYDEDTEDEGPDSSGLKRIGWRVAVTRRAKAFKDNR